jgi:hypothetical protein
MPQIGALRPLWERHGLPMLKGLMRKVVGTITLVVFILIFATWARIHFTTVRVNNDPSTEPNLAEAKSNAQPLLQALENYRGDTGLYPVTLDQLNGKYLPSPFGAHSFRYSARQNDWVYKSDECVAREKSLHGWIMKNANEYKKEVTAFKSECLSGYRYYQLQTRDFPHDPQTLSIDRWAYYDSSNRQWSVGWCSHDGTAKGHPTQVAENGVCRWWEHRHSDPW